MTKSSFNFVIAALLSICILLPIALTPVKGFLLFLALLLVAKLHFQRGASFARETFFLALIYVCAGLSWSVFGLIRGNPGAIAVLTVMAVYPILFTLLASAYKISDAEALAQFFISLALALGLFNLLYISGSLLLPQNPVQNFIEDLYRDEAVVDVGETYYKFTTPNISSCIFLLPFLMTSFFHSKRFRLRTGVSLAAMLAIMLLSGRRGFFIGVFGGLLVTYLITCRPNLKPSFKIRFSAPVLIFMAVTSLCLGWFFTSFYGAAFYIAEISSIVNFTTNESNIERSLQFSSMMSEFIQSPIFGAGAGAAAQYSRSIEQPWAYELAYVAFLFQYGALGFIIYVSGIFLLVYHLAAQVRKKGRNSFEFFYLAGFISFMIANTTNPYLAKFDYMWVIFIPVAIMNQRLLCSHRGTLKYSHR